uniref:CG-1 domain-containing protein n=1 Tax=Parascaris univalens TaxID=6257 RepID=A0A914ZVJ3_PARUN
MQTQLVNFVAPLDEFPANHARWNSNEEVARILCSAQRHPEWLCSEVRAFPPSTSQWLFKRLDGIHFKQDGYEWKRRKEGKLIREDHVKLKVQKCETIAGSYVHSAVVPSFHRRIYWLFD